MTQKAITKKRPLRDPRLSFDEATHVYTLDGERQLVSATQFIKAFFKPFDFDKQAVAYARKRGLNPDDVKAEWTAKRDYGTLVHSIIEKYINKEIQIQDVENHHAEEAISVLAKLGNTYKYPEEHSEVRIYSEEHGVAGTIDCVLLQDGGTFILVDWKTNAKIWGDDQVIKEDSTLGSLLDFNFTHYTLQLSLYSFILEAEYGLKCRALKLVHLQDGKNIIYDITFTRDIIEQMLMEAKDHGTIR